MMAEDGGGAGCQSFVFLLTPEASIWLRAVSVFISCLDFFCRRPQCQPALCILILLTSLSSLPIETISPTHSLIMDAVQLQTHKRMEPLIRPERLETLVNCLCLMPAVVLCH